MLVNRPPKRTALALAVAGLCACSTPVPLAPGCRPWDGAQSSSEPPTHCFFFPAGVTMDPLGDLLYVTNFNADLSFGGGTLVTVDLPRYERAVTCFRRYGTRDGGDAECGQVSCAQ